MCIFGKENMPENTTKIHDCINKASFYNNVPYFIYILSICFIYKKMLNRQIMIKRVAWILKINEVLLSTHPSLCPYIHRPSLFIHRIHRSQTLFFFCSS